MTESKAFTAHTSAYVGTLAILLVLMPCLVLVEGKTCGGFSPSCILPNITENGVLTALCEDDMSNLGSTSIDLNAHIGADNNGNLVPNSSGFANQCRNKLIIQLQSSTNSLFELEASCKKTSGKKTSWKTSTLLIDRYLKDVNGRLVWDSCTRRRSLL
ncbi:hypothetical protein R1flu_001455 [Riccia fluitans]|uniref:Cyanovirin-N domain-containing protein n=1 Tax=Riccia fluitans TaxID=41844 RepID=A0ABD1Y3F1_9MARC